MSATDEPAWNEAGLAAAVVQDAATGEVLMLAWMNRDALKETLRRGEAVFWSRSRGRLWHKGERSGQVLRLLELRLDCDGDTLLLKVDRGDAVACHTGRRSCFYRRLEDGAWREVEPVLKDPGSLYGGDGG